MSKAALAVYHAVLTGGTQAAVLPIMQTRAELYEHLDYERYEQKLDELFGSRGHLEDGLSKIEG